MDDLMKEDNKTKKELVHELTELRSQDAALKKSITGSISAELAANVLDFKRQILIYLYLTKRACA
jgi:hypothetical protein